MLMATFDMYIYVHSYISLCVNIYKLPFIRLKSSIPRQHQPYYLPHPNQFCAFNLRLRLTQPSTSTSAPPLLTPPPPLSHFGRDSERGCVLADFTAPGPNICSVRPPNFLCSATCARAAAASHPLEPTQMSVKNYILQRGGDGGGGA